MSDSCKDGASKSNDDDVCEVGNMLQNMNTDDDDGRNGVSVMPVCANCGKGGTDLKSCTACKMVKYCNRECQIAHRPQHKKKCRRHAAELHDIELFKQPPPLEDCLICFEKLPSLRSGSKYMVCCGKVICSGCSYAPVYDNQGNRVDNQKCAFCRTHLPTSEEEVMERIKERVEANDARAIHNVGFDYSEGASGYPQDYTKALELWQRAAELGCAEAFCSIGYAYDQGRGVEVDTKKARYYFELSAIGGHVDARHNLGVMEEENAFNFNRAVKHHTIAVRGGYTDSLKIIKDLYSDGLASKEDYTKALQSYQAYLDEIKNDQRDEAAAFSEDYRYY